MNTSRCWRERPESGPAPAPIVEINSQVRSRNGGSHHPNNYEPRFRAAGTQLAYVIRAAIGKQAGDAVTVHLEERVDG